MSHPASAPPSEDWAIEHARASLRIGLKVQEIEQRLVAHGLTSEAATSVVTRALEDRIRQENESKERAGRRLRLHRILSGLVVILYVLVGFWIGGAKIWLYTAIYSMVLLPYIWFAERIDWPRGRSSILWPYITAPPASSILRLTGWILLSLPGVFIFYVVIYRLF